MKRITALCMAAVLCLSLLSGCAKSGGDHDDLYQNVDLATFAQTVQEKHEFPVLDRIDPEDPDMGAIMLENTYPGLKDMDLKQMEVYLAIISFSGGELSLIEAKNSEDAAKVKDIFQARIDAKSADGPGNYPEELEMWQRNSRLVSQGNYVLLVCNEDSDAIVSEFNALFNA